MDAAGSSGADGGELAAGEAAVERISSRRGGGVGASKRGAGFEPGQAEKFALPGAASDPEEVGGRAGAAVWADASGRALGGGRRDWDRGGDAAGLDARGRVVEPRTAQAGAQGAFWGIGAVGRELSRLAGRAGAGGLPDEHGG